VVTLAPTACKYAVSGSISPAYSAYFSPFPRGTGSLSVTQSYLALPDGAGGFRQGSSGPALLRIPAQLVSLRVQDYHPLWFTFPGNSTHETSLFAGPTTPVRP
jgi:hypothetical protein